MDSPIIINLVSPLSFLGVLGVIFIFLSHFSMRFLCANRNSSRWDAVLRRHIWGYAVCLCPIKGTPGLNELIKAASLTFSERTVLVSSNSIVRG